jgi:hypothetical protein
MDYLTRRNRMPDETPEIYWYFPYFIDFCKEYDLTTYKPVGDFELYELIMDDFEEYYLNDSEWAKNYVNEKGDSRQQIYDNYIYSFDYSCKWFFKKNAEGIWQYGTTNDPYSGNGEFVEIIGEVTPVVDNFELYKTPEVTQPPTSTEVSSSKTTSPERYITPDGNVKYVTEG